MVRKLSADSDITAIPSPSTTTTFAPLKNGLSSFELRWSVEMPPKTDADDSKSSKSQEHDSDGEDAADDLTPLSPQATYQEGPDVDADERCGPRPKSTSHVNSKVASKRPRAEGWRRFKAKLKTTKQNDMIHQMWSAIHGRLYHSPLEDATLKRALDIGTGRGLWAMEFASRHRDCEVTAVDFQFFENWEALNPLGPDGQRPLPNLHFQGLPPDKGLRWDFPEAFDFIHARSLSFTVDHASVFQSMFNNLNPGGWAEFNEWAIDLRSSNGHSPGRGDAAMKWNAAVAEGAKVFGQNTKAALNFQPLLEDLGFVDVVQFHFHVPLNPWVPDPEMKQLAEMAHRVLTMNALRPISMGLLGAGLGWSASRIDALVAELMKDLSNPDFHIYVPVVMTYCRKPDSTAANTSQVTITPGHDTTSKEYAYTYNTAKHLPIWF